MMANPWLDVPLDDYEGHMRAAGVEQLGVLSELFAEALSTCRPVSVAILGIAGGNGLEAVDLVHAALIFEHAGTARCFENALAMLVPAGHLSVVLQLPSDIEHEVGPSKFVAVQKLGSHFSLVNRETLIGLLAAQHCELVSEWARPLPAGKAFWMGLFRRAESSPELR